MGFYDIVAIIAVLISSASAWVSYKAYRYTVDTKEAELYRAFKREKSEFLVRIERAQTTFEQLEHEIGVYLQKIIVGPESKRSSLSMEIEELKSDLSYIEGCCRQARSLWAESCDMRQDSFSHHKPRFSKLIEDDQEFAAEARERLKLVEEKL